MDISTYEKWKAYWSKENNPHHAYQTSKGFNNYADEVMFHIGKANSIVDTGCGSGEIISRLAPHYSKIIGIDYSNKMITASNELINSLSIENIELHNADLMDIDAIIKEPVDCIYNVGVIQYLNEELVNTFIKKAIPLIKPNGKIIFMHVPDIRCFDLYAIGFFHTDKIFSMPELILKYLRFKFHLFRKKLFSPKYKYDGDIGYWYSQLQIRKLAEQNNLVANFFYVMHKPYGYRFNVTFMRKHEQ